MSPEHKKHIEFKSFRRQIEVKLISHLLYNIEMYQPTKDVIVSVREKLKETHKNVVIYFNHIAYGDPLFALYIAEKIAPSHSHHLIFPLSYSHTDSDNPKNHNFIDVVREAQRCGVELQRVIQGYQIDNPDFGYTKAQAVEQNMKFIQRLDELNKNAQPTICFISPEGTRSTDNSLHKAERGLGDVGRVLAPALYLPVGIVYPRGYERESVNIGETVSLTVGSPKDRDLAIKESLAIEESITREGDNENKYDLTQYLMEHLTSCLPPSMHGAYAKTSISPHLSEEK